MEALWAALGEYPNRETQSFPRFLVAQGQETLRVDHVERHDGERNNAPGGCEVGFRD